METHAAGGTQGGQDGREDADSGLNDELPEVLLGVVTENGDGFYLRHLGCYVRVSHCVVYRLIDGLLDELGYKFLK